MMMILIRFYCFIKGFKSQKGHTEVTSCTILLLKIRKDSLLKFSKVTSIHSKFKNKKNMAILAYFIQCNNHSVHVSINNKYRI